jgi:DNA-directed RNA polymerase subunit RPC12/RpoP
MREFKYACPVCGQHIRCDSSQAGSVMECPTCFQKITAPQAPSTDDSKFIITGTKVGERPTPKIPEETLRAPEAKSFSGVTAVLLILICAAAAAGFIYRGTIFKSRSAPVAPTSSEPEHEAVAPSWPTVAVPANLPIPAGTNYWTLNVNAVGTPEVPAGGKVHGKFFAAQRMILNPDGLTIRTADLPPQAGITIYLRPNPISRLFGKSLLFEPNTPGAPTVLLRWKDQGREAEQGENTGYALRLEFGQPVSNSIPGKIYLCTPDAFKSYVVGKFDAEIIKPQTQ